MASGPTGTPDHGDADGVRSEDVGSDVARPTGTGAARPRRSWSPTGRPDRRTQPAGTQPAGTQPAGTQGGAASTARNADERAAGTPLPGGQAGPGADPDAAGAARPPAGRWTARRAGLAGGVLVALALATAGAIGGAIVTGQRQIPAGGLPSSQAALPDLTASLPAPISPSGQGAGSASPLTTPSTAPTSSAQAASPQSAGSPQPGGSAAPGADSTGPALPAYAQPPGLPGFDLSKAEFVIPARASDPRAQSWLSPAQAAALQNCGASTGGFGAVTGSADWKLTGWGFNCRSAADAQNALPVVAQAAGPAVPLDRGVTAHAWTPPGTSQVWLDATYRSGRMVIRFRVMSPQTNQAAAQSVATVALNELAAIYPVSSA